MENNVEKVKTEETVDLDALITIKCKIHGPFQMRARDHIGENDEKIAYGCPECGDNVTIQ